MPIGKMRVMVGQGVANSMRATSTSQPWLSVLAVLQAQRDKSQRVQITGFADKAEASVLVQPASENVAEVKQLRAEDVPVPSDDDDDL